MSSLPSFAIAFIVLLAGISPYTTRRPVSPAPNRFTHSFRTQPSDRATEITTHHSSVSREPAGCGIHGQTRKAQTKELGQKKGTKQSAAVESQGTDVKNQT